MLPNVARARDYMDRTGLRAILVSSNINVSYLTGFDCWLYQKYTEDMLVLGAPHQRKEAFALLAADGRPTLLVDSYTSLFASELDGIELRCYGGEPVGLPRKPGLSKHEAFFRGALATQKGTPVAALVSALKEKGIVSGRVAVEVPSMRRGTLSALKSALPKVEFVDGSLVIALIRMVKTEGEIEILTKAARINERALYKSLEVAGTGVPIGDLSQRYLVEVSREGAIFDHYFYSPDGLWLSGAAGYRLRKGEYTIIDTGCTYNLYFGDMGTTLLVGRKRRDVVAKYSELWETIDQVADLVQPGTTPSEVMAIFGDLYRRRGVRNPDYQGHGIGLAPREYPIMGQGGPERIADGAIKTTTEIPLEVGMVISLETSIYEPGEGSYEVERTFVVGKSSLKELATKKDQSIYLSES